MLQDLAQVHERWNGRADTVVNNHRAKLFGAASTCAQTLEGVSAVLGDTSVPEASTTSTHDGKTATASTTYRPLAPPHLVRERKLGSFLLLYGSVPPVLVRTRPWFKDRRYRWRARGKVA